jgi:hypothetical protein
LFKQSAKCSGGTNLISVTRNFAVLYFLIENLLISGIFSFCREKYGNFLNQLETVYNVSQMAVTAIMTEMTTLSNFIHSFTVKQVSEKLGKFSLFFVRCLCVFKNV